MKHKKSFFYIAIIAPLLFQGCFIANKILVDDPLPEVESLQNRSEKAVKNYLANELGTDYEPYGFSRVTIIMPAAIVSRDSLEEISAQYPSEERTRELADLNGRILKSKLERKISLSHFYSVQTDSNYFDVFENTFILSDSLLVKKRIPTTYITLEGDKKPVLENFFFEDIIFSSMGIYQSSVMSKKFYAFYKNKLDSYEFMLKKAAFLMHSLRIVELVKGMGDYDPHEIAKKIISEKLRSEFDNNDYNPLQWSILNEVSSADTGIEGYYFFHEFTLINAANKDTVVKRFEFNPYLESKRSRIMDKPYGQYFE